MPKNEDPTRRKVTEALAIAAATSGLTGDTEQPWPPADGLSAHDIERLVHWAEGEDAHGRPYGDYLGVRERIFVAREQRQSIAPILRQLQAEQARINPRVLCDHILVILDRYDRGERLTTAERETIREIVVAWPPTFEAHGNVRTRVGLVDSIVNAAPIMHDLLITDTVLSKEELTLWNQG